MVLSLFYKEVQQHCELALDLSLFYKEGMSSTVSLSLEAELDSRLQAQEEAELAQLRDARRRALEQRDAQMRQLDDLKARILAERYDHAVTTESSTTHSSMPISLLTVAWHIHHCCCS